MLAEHFYEQMSTAVDKRAVLIQLYISLFGEQKINLYSLFGRLLKLYSPESVFFAVLECHDSTNFNSNEPYGLLSYICRKRLEQKYSTIKTIDLSKYESDFDKFSKRKLKLKGSPFDN